MKTRYRIVLAGMLLMFGYKSQAQDIHFSQYLETPTTLNPALFGLNYDTRSHFDAQEYIELGTPGSKSTASGWITRHLQTTGISSILPVISTTGQPTSLLNFVPTVSVSTPDEFSLWDKGLRDSHMNALRQLYTGDSLIHRAGARTLDALDIVRPLNGNSYQPSNGAYYNDDELGRQLKTIAQMIKLDAGLRVAAVDFGGWDHHESEGVNDTWGHYADNRVERLLGGMKKHYRTPQAIFVVDPHREQIAIAEAIVGKQQ